MDSRARSFSWLAALIAVLAWVLWVVPLAAQSVGRIAVRSSVQIPTRDIFQRPAQAASGFEVAPDRSNDGAPSTADALIEQMSLAADVIFAGRVTTVRRPIGLAGSGQDGSGGIVEIDLYIDQALRGPATGSIYTLREWSGLWAGGANRYQVGQRLLLFLYAPDAHGLSSPVHGAEGAIPLRGSGTAPGPDDATTATAEWLVDLRWLQAQVPRRSLSTVLPVRSPIGPIYPPRPIHGIVSEESGDRSQLESDPLLVHAIREPWLHPAPAPVEAQPLSQVLALCHEAITLDAMRRRDAAR